MLRLIRNNQILNHTVRGSGPPIVLLHGYLCSLHYWDHVSDQLEKNFTVINLDLLGFGKSPKPKTNAYDYEDHLRWITNTLELYDTHENITMIGHSMGALIALRFATERPDKISRLVLMNPPVFKDGVEARRELANTNLLFRAGLYWDFHRVICPIMDTGIMRQIARQLISEKYKGMEEYLFVSSATARKRTLQNVIEAQRSISEIENLGVPTTIISGRKERHTYLENLQSLTTTDNIEIVLTDTGHHTPIEQPEMLLRAANIMVPVIR